MDHLHPITLADICSGDLFLFARPSPIQYLSDLIDDPFRGIGVAIRTADGVSVVYVGRAGVVTADLAAISARFDAIAVGRRPDCVCMGEVLEAVGRLAAEANHYPLSSLVGAFVLSAARTPGVRSPWSAPLRRTAGLLARAQARGLDVRVRAGHRFICSTFVAAAYEHACPRHHLDVPIACSKGCRPGEAPNPADLRLTRYFVTPSDLWRATPTDRRARLVGVPLRGGPRPE